MYRLMRQKIAYHFGVPGRIFLVETMLDACIWRPGAAELAKELSDWCEDNLSEVWYNTVTGAVVDVEPEGYWIEDIAAGCGPEGDLRLFPAEPVDFIHLDEADVKYLLFGELLT